MTDELQIEASKTIDWYNQNAKEYADKNSGRARHNQIQKFLNLLPDTPVVVDIGCGPGRDTSILSKNNCKVLGLDLSEGLINEAKKRYPKINFILADMTNVPLENCSVDGVWANASLLHLPHLDQVRTTLGEFSRILKKGGIAFIRVKAQKSSMETAVVIDQLSEAKRFFRYFQLDNLVNMIKEFGFEIISADQFNESEENLELTRPEVDWIVVLARKK
jgi:ubiquinone/menaquinone biosynthesis C-methylase UbiE